MAKFYGKVGFGTTVETSPDIWVPQIKELFYYGDVVRRTQRWQSGDKVNDDWTISQDISIVADPFAIEHFFEIRYVVWRGVAWKVTSVDPQFPRLILSLGGVYNGEQAGSEQDVQTDSGE